MILYDDMNDYLTQNIDKDVLRDSYCFDNDTLLSTIKQDPNITCANHYPNISDIHYKIGFNYNLPEAKLTQSERDEKNNKGPDFIKNHAFYDSRTDMSYSFAELCPITTKQLSSTLCLRRHNNDISDTMFRIDNVLTDTELNLKNNLNDIDDLVSRYRDDKYRLFNSTEVQEYVSNNNI